MAVKTIGEFERQYNMLVLGANPNQKISEEDFNAIPIDQKKGVDFAAREAFLTANDYEITRENLIDGGLSAKDPAPSESQ